MPRIGPATTQFNPNSSFVSPASSRTLQQTLSGASLTTDTLRWLAYDSHELWLEQGTPSTFAIFMNAVEAAFPTLSNGDQIDLPATLFDLLLCIHGQLPMELLPHFANQIQDMMSSGRLNDFEKMRMLGAAIEACGKWLNLLPKAFPQEDHMFAVAGQVQNQLTRLSSAYSSICYSVIGRIQNTQSELVFKAI